jgi:intracellular sulfur oxidation DsrE/DsrF family protein
MHKNQEVNSSMLNNQPAQKLKVILHAPTGNALQRARNNARNLKKATPDAEIRIIVNAEAVTTALDTVEADTDMMTWVCPNTLAKLNRELRTPLTLLQSPAILELVLMQQSGWTYIRA